MRPYSVASYNSNSRYFVSKNFFRHRVLRSLNCIYTIDIDSSRSFIPRSISVIDRPGLDEVPPRRLGSIMSGCPRRSHLILIKKIYTYGIAHVADWCRFADGSGGGVGFYFSRNTKSNSR